MGIVNATLECSNQGEYATYVVPWQVAWTVTMQDAQYAIQCLVSIWMELYVPATTAFLSTL